MSKLLHLFLLALPLVSTANAFAAQPETRLNYAAEDARERFKNVIAKFDERATRLMEKLRSAPERTRVPFKTDRAALRSELDNILIDAAEVIGQSELVDLKKKADEISRRMVASQTKISQLELDKLGAKPSEGRLKSLMNGNWVYLTREEITGMIQTERQSIELNKKDLLEIKKQIAINLRKNGIRVSESQVNALIFSVTGEADLQMISVYTNMSLITEMLKQYMAESSGSLEASRKYYAIHCLLLRTLMALQKNYIEKVDQLYLPKLDEVQKNVSERLELAQAELDKDTLDPAVRRQWEMNQNTKRLTLRIAERYKEILASNRERMGKSIAGLEERYKVAEDSYLTIDSALGLMQMVNQSQQEFTSLMSLEIPPLASFSSAELVEFESLTSKLTAR